MATKSRHVSGVMATMQINVAEENSRPLFSNAIVPKATVLQKQWNLAVACCL